jgi:hypothetical protein
MERSIQFNIVRVVHNRYKQYKFTNICYHTKGAARSIKKYIKFSIIGLNLTEKGGRNEKSDSEAS